MKPILERMFFRAGRQGRPPISSVSSALTNRDIENYYVRIIGNCLHRLLVPDETWKSASAARAPRPPD